LQTRAFENNYYVQIVKWRHGSTQIKLLEMEIAMPELKNTP